MYEFLHLGLTRAGTLDPGSTGDPACQEVAWSARVAPMTSAYAAANGAEPSFTNFNQVCVEASHLTVQFKSEPAFCETLDYIFCSKDIKVATVLPLPESRATVSGPFPNSAQPSDHMMIAATLNVPILD